MYYLSIIHAHLFYKICISNSYFFKMAHSLNLLTNSQVVMELEFIKNIEIFQEALNDIQAKYYYWFESRHGVHINQEHDVIKNHILLDYKEYNNVLMGYIPSSELPPNIRAECNEAFESIFRRAIPK